MTPGRFKSFQSKLKMYAFLSPCAMLLPTKQHRIVLKNKKKTKLRKTPVCLVVEV